MNNGRRDVETASIGSPVTGRELLPWVVGTALAFVALIALDQAVVHTAVLTPFQGLDALSPLYAFWMPRFRPAAVLFVLLALSWAFWLPALVSSRISGMWFGTSLLMLSVALPLALFLVRDDPGRIGSQFLIYRGEEYFDDALRIADLKAFLRNYTALTPQLSLHGRTHPPGFATFLYMVGRIAGPSPLAAGAAVLLAFGAGMLLAWRAFALVLDQRPARIAALSLLAAPSLLDFACTSMDAVFFGAASLVLLTVFLSLSERGRWWHAVLAGPALYVAMFCSFSAFPLGLFIALYGTLLWWERRAWQVPLQLSIVLVSFVMADVAVRYGLGFDLWESFQIARTQNSEIMAHAIGRSIAGAYVPMTLGNIGAFLIGTGLAVVPLFARSASQALRARGSRSLFLATAGTLAVVCAGGLYTMETERILMFAMPWVAVSAASAATLPDSAVVLMMSAGWAQAFAMEVFLFTLW